MAVVNVNVNGKTYAVGCEDGQESHVETLARDFDRQVREVGEQVGQVGELRLFLMAALVGSDELIDLRQRFAHAQSELARLRSGRPDRDGRAAKALNEAAERIEALTAGLGA